MAIQLIQKTHNFELGVGTTFSGTLAGNVAGGNLLIAAVNTFIGTIVNITDTRGNTYIPIGTAINGASGGNDIAYLYYVKDALPGSTILTAGFDSIHIKSMGLYEYSGCDWVNPLDTFNFGSGLTTTNNSPGAITPSQNNSLIFSLGGDFTALGTRSVTAAPSFALQGSVYPTTNLRFYTEDFVQSTAAAITGSFTLQDASNTYAIAAAFRPYPTLGTITADVNISNESSTKAAGTQTFSLTGGGLNRMVQVQVLNWGSNRATGSVTLNGTNMTKAMQFDANNVNSSAWYFMNPVVQNTGTIIVKQPAVASKINFTVMLLNNVKQTSQPHQSGSNAVSNSGGRTDTMVNYMSNAWAFDSIGDQSAVMSGSTGQTVNLSYDTSTSEASYKPDNGLGNVNMSWTWTGAETGAHGYTLFGPGTVASASVFLPRLNLLGVG